MRLTAANAGPLSASFASSAGNTGFGLSVRIALTSGAFAAACVVVSRVTSFEPGYLYGIVAGFAFGRALTVEEEGRRAAVGVLAVLAASVVAWVVWTRLPVTQGDPGFARGVADTVLATVSVGGFVGLVVGLVPVRPLPGRHVVGWNRRAWAALYGLVLFLFLHVLLHPRAGLGDHPVPFVTWLGLFLAFGAVSVAFWAYFQRRPERRSA